eukprot:g22098.t1
MRVERNNSTPDDNPQRVEADDLTPIGNPTRLPDPVPDVPVHCNTTNTTQPPFNPIPQLPIHRALLTYPTRYT